MKNLKKVMNDSSPLVSVIIPVYNGEADLATCIQSVIHQTYSHLEIIIVNDGSTDGSLGIMECHKKGDARIVLINKPNQGPSLARESGVAIAQGKYIQFLDSDDELLAGAIEQLVNRAEATDADMVVAPFFFCSFQEPKTLSTSLVFDELSGVDYLKEILNGKTYWSVWSHFLKRSLLCNHVIETVPNVSFGEDAIMMVQLALHAQRVVSIDTAILDYKIHPSSLSHPQNFDDKKYREFKIYTTWIECYVKESEVSRELVKEITLFHIRNTFKGLYWKRDEGLDEEFKKIVSDIKQFPDLKKMLSRRECKIISAYGLSGWFGNCYVSYCRCRGKI